jgi:membrane dipeptidase
LFKSGSQQSISCILAAKPDQTLSFCPPVSLLVQTGSDMMRFLTMTAMAATLGVAGCQAEIPANTDVDATDTTHAQIAPADHHGDGLQALHDRLLLIDTHVDIGSGYATAELDPGGFSAAQVDLPKMRAGGLDAAFFIVYTGQAGLDDESLATARQTAEDAYIAINRMIRAYPDQIALARTADEVEAIAASGRRVALIGMENAYPLGNSLDDLPLWAARGVRYVSVTHFGNNQFGGSSNPNVANGEPEADPGLSELGRHLIPALNDLGIMVDISHVGKTTMMEAVALSRAPVIASHSGAHGVYQNARNLDDEQLLAIRDNGGVAQMVAFRTYVQPLSDEHTQAIDDARERLGLDTADGRANATPEQWASLRAELTALRDQFPGVTISDFVDHIDHAISVVGVDHVGIASDFDGGGGVDGWEDASQTLEVTRELVLRGYSEDDLAKIWGGNVLRVMRAVEAAAAQ